MERENLLALLFDLHLLFVDAFVGLDNFPRHGFVALFESKLPLALGFGVSSRQDVEFLRGKAEVAVVGSQALRLLNTNGIQAVGDFFHSLR